MRDPFITRPPRSVLFLESFARVCSIAGHSEHIRWVVWFVAACTGLLGAVFLVIWAASGFGELGISGHGLVALILGIVFTSALGIALMALSFYSDRNGNDRSGARVAQTKRDAD